MFTVLFECQMIAQVIQVQQNSPYIHIATTALKMSGNYYNRLTTFYRTL